MVELDHDENTLRNVYLALQDTGMSDEKAIEAINAMQNRGIYFREQADKVRARNR